MKHLRLNRILEDVHSDLVIPFETFRFKGGESHIKLKNESSLVGSEVMIEWYAPQSQDIMTLLLATDALRRAGVVAIELLMPYVPFARQDRVMVAGESLSIKVFTDIINSQNYRKVYTLDNHSEVTTALLDNCKEINRTRLMQMWFAGVKPESMLVAPDAGSMKKTFKISQMIGGLQIISCDKVRNVNTGDIVSTKVYCEDLDGWDCYIPDDICDGGRTFVEIAKVLKRMNCGKLHLYVSHGLFSMGQHKLEDEFDTITCTTLARLQSEVPMINTISLRKEDLK